MRTPGVVPFDPLGNSSASFGEAAKVMQPDALFLETTKEALDEAILLWRIGRNELLAQPVIAAGGGQTAALGQEAPIPAVAPRANVTAPSGAARPPSPTELPRSLALA